MINILYYCFIIHFITYWIFSFISYLLDLKYLDPGHRNWSRYKKAVCNVLLNQLFILIPTIYLLKDKILDSVAKSESDSLFYTIIKIIFIGFFANLLFYTTHYILHTRIAFKLIHYKHHEFIEPIVVGSMYSHPIEYLVSNVLAFLIPFIFFGTNSITLLILIFVSTLFTLHAHCQYKLNGMKNDHLIHHKLFKYNYGFGSYLDIVLNTYK